MPFTTSPIRLLASLVCCAAFACSSPAPAAITPAATGTTVQATGATAFRPIKLPDDDGPHAALTEWWYYNGHVATDSGDTYSFHLVVFKREARGALQRPGYVAHVGITDHQQRVFRYDQQVSVPAPAPPVPGAFDLQVGAVRAAGSNGTDRISGGAGEYQLDLALHAAKPSVIHGDAGIVGVSPQESSYYYSRTRMAAAGTLTLGGRAVVVTGNAWMDHQWGDFSLQGAAGWDWYALQLDDGNDAMISVLRDSAGKVIAQYGTWVAPNGQVTAIKGDRLKAQPTGSWTSPATRTVYPSGWNLDLADQKLAARLSPVTPDQEMDTTNTTGKVYWEGAVDITATRDGKPVAGKGYVELTGYRERTNP